MPQKEFINLIESNLMILDWLNGQIKGGVHTAKYSKQHFEAVVRLYLGGKSLLKDIARKNHVPASNLCATLKHLEKSGLVLRQPDERDRRNTWYSLTSAGTKLAKSAIDDFRRRIAMVFTGLCKTDESKLTTALRAMNEVLNKIQNSYQ